MNAVALLPDRLAALQRGVDVTGVPDAYVDGERSTGGVPMVGDPWISPLGGLLGWRQAQYATAMAQKQGLIGADASHLLALCDGPASVVFVSIETRREIARFTIPARVLAFQPDRAPLRLADQRDVSTSSFQQRSPRVAALRPLTPAQAAILHVLQECGSTLGMESAAIAANHFSGRCVKWSTPKLKALARRGLVVPNVSGRSRALWTVTPTGRAYQLTAQGADK